MFGLTLWLPKQRHIAKIYKDKFHSPCDCDACAEDLLRDYHYCSSIYFDLHFSIYKWVLTDYNKQIFERVFIYLIRPAGRRKTPAPLRVL